MVENNTKKNEEAGDASYFYCQECGMKMKDTSKFCSNCGFNFITYEKNRSNNQTNYVPHAFTYKKPAPTLDWKPIVLGGVIAFVVSLLLGFLSGFFIYNLDILTIIGILVFLTFLSLFIGGLAAGVIAKHSGGTHGAMAGLVCAVISIPINALSGIPVDFFSVFWAIMWAMLFAGIGGLIGHYATKASKIQPQINTQAYYG